MTHTSGQSQPSSPIEFWASRSDVGDLGSALNEVVNGFILSDFDNRVGSFVETERLLRHIGDVYQASSDDQNVVLSSSFALFNR